MQMNMFRLSTSASLSIALSCAMIASITPQSVDATTLTTQSTQDAQPPETNAGSQTQGEDDEKQQQQQERAFSFHERVALFDETFPYDTSHPAVGHWHGNVFTERGVPAASIVITRNEDGSFDVKSSITPGAPPHQQATNVQIDGRTVTFHAPLTPAAAGSLIFKGEVSEDGQRLSGTIEWPGQLSNPGRFELARTPKAMDLENRSAYGGTIELDEGIGFEIIIVLAETPGGNWVGHIDIPQQYVGGWTLDRVVREGDHVMAHMGGGTPAIFDGTISEDGKTFIGVFRQLESEIPFAFERLDDYDGPTVQAPPAHEQRTVDAQALEQQQRPQYPTGDVPYQVREIEIEHEEDHVLSGTLTVPRGAGPFPAAILVSTNGPHDRDAQIYGHKSFLVLGDYLTRRGIAVLRYDERGVGRSTGNFAQASSKDLASDVVASYNFLRAIENVNEDAIGMIAHGEGATVAALAAAQVDSVAFVAMLAPSSIVGWKSRVEQTTQTLSQQPNLDQSLAQEMLDAFAALLKAASEGVAGETLGELATAYAAKEAEVAEALGGSTPYTPDVRARILVSMLTRPDQAWALSFDPSSAFTKLDAPIFAAWGSLDRVNPPDLNRPALQSLADARNDVTTKLYDNVNHLFQPAQTGTPQEMARTRITIAEQVLSDLVDWIQSVTTPVSDDGAASDEPTD